MSEQNFSHLTPEERATLAAAKEPLSLEEDDAIRAATQPITSETEFENEQEPQSPDEVTTDIFMRIDELRAQSEAVKADVGVYTEQSLRDLLKGLQVIVAQEVNTK